YLADESTQPFRSDQAMAADMVVALGRATGDGSALFGQNSGRPRQECQSVRRVPGRSFTPGEVIQTQMLALPQARQTYTVVGNQPAGLWGFRHGLNEHGVAAGCGSVRTRGKRPGPALLVTDLVRLTLERARSARQAVDVLTGLIQRY